MFKNRSAWNRKLYRVLHDLQAQFVSASERSESVKEALTVCAEDIIAQLILVSTTVLCLSACRQFFPFPERGNIYGTVFLLSRICEAEFPVH